MRPGDIPKRSYPGLLSILSAINVNFMELERRVRCWLAE